MSRLQQGKIVQRRTTQQRGELKLIGGQSWQVIDRSPEDTWELLVRTMEHHKFIPGANESNLLSSSRKKKRTELIHTSGPISISYQIDLTFNSDKRTMMIQFVPNSSKHVRAGWGFAKIRPWHNDQTLISFGMLIDIGEGLLTGFIRPAVQRWLLLVPSDIKRYVEASLSKKS